jgi:hypothetical protein
MRLSWLLSKHSADAANIQKSNSVNHLINLCATIWGSTSTGRGKLVARKLVAATWTRDNWTRRKLNMFTLVNKRNEIK